MVKLANNPLIMSAFTGQLYWVTQYSIYRVTVADLVSSPSIVKVATRGGKKLGVPVGGRFHGKFYIAITGKGLFRYSMFRHQRTLSERPVKKIEEVGRRQRGMRANSPVGIFLSREKADECYFARSEKTFDPQWHKETLEVLEQVGQNHPLITISTEGRFAIPHFPVVSEAT